jgi:DnaJ-class molecular chaperone
MTSLVNRAIIKVEVLSSAAGGKIMTRFSTLIKPNLVGLGSIWDVCWNCGGKGTTGIWFWKKTCEECSGTGKVIRKIKRINNSSLTKSTKSNKTKSTRPTIP